MSTLQVDLPELQGATCEEIAIQKCKMAAEHVKGPVMCEDTSLCYHALKGLPGTNLDFVVFLGGLGGTVAHREQQRTGPGNTCLGTTLIGTLNETLCLNIRVFRGCLLYASLFYELLMTKSMQLTYGTRFLGGVQVLTSSGSFRAWDMKV